MVNVEFNLSSYLGRAGVWEKGFRMEFETGEMIHK
jgi:hypothetical protein